MTLRAKGSGPKDEPGNLVPKRKSLSETEAGLRTESEVSLISTGGDPAYIMDFR
jgi:hypothetical protein